MWSYSEEGLETRINLHNTSHAIETAANMRRFEAAAKKQPPRDYNMLHLTWQDVTFLLTRGIALDEHTMWEGYCGHGCKPKT